MLTEKYRPKEWSEVIGQNDIVRKMKAITKRGFKEIPHLCFIGMPGCGKTTIAYIVAKELNVSIEEINASDERGIDVIRGKVKNYSKMSKDLIILLDECDNLTFDSQQALRRILELSKNKFILSANKENKVISPIKSRCALFHFDGLQDKDVLL